MNFTNNLTDDGLTDFPVLLDTRQAAALLSVSRQWLEAARVKGGGPAFVKIGGAVRYRKSDLLAFIDGRIRRSTSDTVGEGMPQTVLRGRFRRA